MDNVSSSIPRPIHQPIHRPMHRSIYRMLLDRPSTDTRLTCRSTVDRCFGRASTDVGRGIDRKHIGSLSVNYRRNVGRVAFDSRVRVYQYNLPIYQPILSVIIDTIDRYLILSTDVSTNVLADTCISTDTRAFIDWLCVGRVSTNVSTDISTDIN